MMFKIRKVALIIIDRLFFKALLKGCAAGTEHTKPLLTMGDFAHVVDIGANRGQFALVARKCFPSALIDSFEPLIEPAAIFENVFVYDGKTRLHKFAIGSERSKSLIHISNRDDSSSLLPISNIQTTLFSRTEEKETRKIEVVPLSDILSIDDIRSPALLKIDVQGYEYPVLQGCQPLLHKFQHVYVECSFVELYVGQALVSSVIHFLSANNFQLGGVYNLHYDGDGKAIQADFHFISQQ